MLVKKHNTKTPSLGECEGDSSCKTVSSDLNCCSHADAPEKCKELLEDNIQREFGKVLQLESVLGM